MSAVVFNLLLAVVGAFLFVGVTAIPALIQWPVRPLRTPRPRRTSAGYRRPAPAFGGAYA